MAEMFGKVEGCSRGRGGSMHLFDAATRFYGGNAIVGGGLPLAVGLALADRCAADRRVTACFFGEGAVAEGEFHESMNLAALWRPAGAVLLREQPLRDGHGAERSESETDLALKAAATGCRPGRSTAWTCSPSRTPRARVEPVRGGGGPVFLELRTYRFRAHSMYDPERYRDKAEVERWRERDPIELLAARCAPSGRSTTTTSRDRGRGRRARSTTRSPSPRPARSSRSRTSPASSTASEATS
jgi:pyruvate dehydrogenase E1 component alpha subunit